MELAVKLKLVGLKVVSLNQNPPTAVGLKNVDLF